MFSLLWLLSSPTWAGPDHDDDGYDEEDECDDDDPDVHPGAEEVCNGIDDDCDEVIDPGCPPETGDTGEPPATTGTTGGTDTDPGAEATTSGGTTDTGTPGTGGTSTDGTTDTDEGGGTTTGDTEEVIELNDGRPAGLDEVIVATSAGCACDSGPSRAGALGWLGALLVLALDRLVRPTRSSRVPAPPTERRCAGSRSTR